MHALLTGRAFKQNMCQVMKTAREFWCWGFLLQSACKLMASQEWECKATELLKMFSRYIHRVLQVLKEGASMLRSLRENLCQQALSLYLLRAPHRHDERCSDASDNGVHKVSPLIKCSSPVEPYISILPLASSRTTGDALKKM